MSTAVGIWKAAVMHDETEDFSARVAENQRRVFQIAMAVLANAADAEDVAQEAFLRAYRKRRLLRESQSFHAWVNRIAFRLALNRQRAQRRQLARDFEWHTGATVAVDGSRQADGRMVLSDIRKLIDELPEKLRSALLLCAIEGMSIEEVAVALRVPAGTVRSRLHNARRRLLETMDR